MPKKSIFPKDVKEKFLIPSLLTYREGYGVEI